MYLHTSTASLNRINHSTKAETKEEDKMERLFDIALSFATEDQSLVEDIYQYLKAENLKVFFAPSPEGQAFISGKNQREVFYRIFGIDSEYVALFVTKDYIVKKIPMEEARIAFAKHSGNSTVIPIYVDGTALPPDLFSPAKTNYYCSSNPANIAAHLADRCKPCIQKESLLSGLKNACGMYVSGNTAENQIFINEVTGTVKL